MERTRHRNLFNGDWGTFFWAPGLWQPEGGPYSAEAIHRYVDLLADSGVDTFLISPNTQVAWYPSKAVPTALDGYARGDQRWAQWLPGIASETNMTMIDHYLDLQEAGIDWLAEAVKACRARGISPWVSVRMNDMHGAADPAGNPINCPLFADPQYRLKGTTLDPHDPVNPYYQALNYECREVRDYMLSMIRELVMDYAFEGLELDWLRNPTICEPGVSQETTDVMTAWIAEIRALTQARAEQTGRPYVFGMRIPGELSMLRSIGLDVKAVAREGLVDFVNPSNFMQTAWTMPHDRLRAELGDDVAMYGVIELIINDVKGYSPELDEAFSRYPCASAPSLRGNAAGKLVLGADGIEQYNYYAADEDNFPRLCTADNMRADYAAIRDVHDLEALRGQPKHYALETMFCSCWYPSADRPEPLPAILEPQWRRAFMLPMCAEPGNRGLELIVQVVIEKLDGFPGMGVAFNGGWPLFDARPTRELLFSNRPATHHVPEYQAYDYRFNVEEIREGWNEIVLLCGSDRTGSKEGNGNQVKVVGIELAVKPVDTRKNN